MLYFLSPLSVISNGITPTHINSHRHNRIKVRIVRNWLIVGLKLSKKEKMGKCGSFDAVHNEITYISPIRNRVRCRAALHYVAFAMSREALASTVQ